MIVFDVLLESSIRVLLVAAAVALILWAARVRSSSLQHAAWTAVLCAMLLMPVLPHLVPGVALPLSPKIEMVPAPPSEAAPLPAEERTAPIPATPSAATATPPAPDPAPPVVSPSRPVWPAIAAVIYSAGVLFLLLRLALGWRAASRILHASARIPGHAPVYESSLVATPLTIGVTSPRIILPAGWRGWPAHKLQSVLAHEQAHVHRRDTLIGLLSHFNRAFFWFHPLAWWLERRLATTAEHACDAAAIRATGESRRYAEVLLDIAETMQRRGGRLSLQGIGVDGSGLLGERIDRVLRGDLLSTVTGTRSAIVAASCLAAIFLAVACRKPVTPLKEDPSAAAQWEQRKALIERSRTIRQMTPEQAAQLVAALKNNPEDLDARTKLLSYYVNKKDIAGKREQILWLIRHHPENELLREYPIRTTGPLADPAGYEQAKRLWLGLSARSGVTSETLGNAAALFIQYGQSSDLPLGEKLLLMAQAKDPKNERWSGRLGSLYARIIAGADSIASWSLDSAAVHSAYAMEVRKKLEASTDPNLLCSAGEGLVRFGSEYYWSGASYAPSPLHLELDALGTSYLERALKLNPQLRPRMAEAKSMLVSRQRSIWYKNTLRPLRKLSPEAREQAISALPDTERFRVLSDFAASAYHDGDRASDEKHDQAAAKAAWKRARNYASQALELAGKLRGDPNYGTVLYQANIVLGMVALRPDGDRKKAARYMLEASKAPATDEIAYLYQDYSYRLPGYLLRYGERESVIEYLQRFAQVSVIQKDDLLKSAAQIRQGIMPPWHPDIREKQYAVEKQLWSK